MKNKKKIALFGGTFDPIHLGHTKVANTAAEFTNVQAVIFIPAKRSALKPLPKVSDQHRINMINLAIDDFKNFHVSDCELKRESPSFTLETVKEIKKQLRRNTEIYWLLGSDTIEELPRWFGVLDLIDECNLTCMYRAGFEPPDFTKYEQLLGRHRVQKLHDNIVQTPLVDISSTEIRQRCAAGQDLAGLVHPAVAEYIQRHKLYR
jgi:nicotinate-nucleotide adenylyltransferase